MRETGSDLIEGNLEPFSENCNPDKLILMEVQDSRFKPSAHMTEIFSQESRTFGFITFSSDSTFKCFALMSEKCKFTLQSIPSFRNTGAELERTLSQKKKLERTRYR